ncbi:MAG: hypothetical protein JWP75_1596 [Frondihabitans sp.]|nr:hypothetical protein [Frondihabitans sp.]
MSAERRLKIDSLNPALLLGLSILFLARWQLRTLLVASAAGTALVSVVGAGSFHLALVAACAPFVVLVFIAIHETAHWFEVKRRLRSPSAGALISSGRKIFIRRPELKGTDLLVVSLAGPLSAGTIASACAVASREQLPLCVVFAMVALAQFSALTPWTRDGVDIAAALDPHR